MTPPKGSLPLKWLPMVSRLSLGVSAGLPSTRVASCTPSTSVAGVPASVEHARTYQRPASSARCPRAKLPPSGRLQPKVVDAPSGWPHCR